jgi:hypothetical protein
MDVGGLADQLKQQATQNSLEQQQKNVEARVRR